MTLMFYRQLNMKLRPFTYSRLDFNLAFMPFHDLLDDGQTQSRAAAFGREKGRENLVHMFLRNPAPGVRDHNFDSVSIGLCAYPKSTTRSHSLASIFHEIDQHLPDLILIQGDLHIAQSEVLFNRHAGRHLDSLN